MAEFILICIAAIHIFWVVFTGLSKLGGPLFQRYQLSMRYGLWKLVFAFVPIFFILLLSKALLFTVIEPNAFIKIQIPKTDDSVVSTVVQGHPEIAAEHTGNPISAPSFPPDGMGASARAFLSGDRPAKAIVAIYAAGIFISFCYAVLSHRRTSGYLGRFQEKMPDDQLAYKDALCRSLHLNAVPTYYHPFLSTPLIMGLREPVVLIPKKEYARSELDFVLKHEFAHLQRRDLMWKAIAVCGVCLLWCNPLVYFGRKQMEHVCELTWGC